MEVRELAGLIDHTLLKVEASTAQVRAHCAEAVAHGFCAVCVNPVHVRLACREVAGSAVKVCTVAGFPLGATTPEIKAWETERAIDYGAGEVDMVLNVGAMKDGNTDLVFADVRAVVGAARGRALVKVILETCLLQAEEIVRACLICREAGADFVKTSTGLNGPGATVENVALMRRTVGPGMGVKAAGGIRDYRSAVALVNAGANRIGTSASVAIVAGAP